MVSFMLPKSQAFSSFPIGSHIDMKSLISSDLACTPVDRESPRTSRYPQSRCLRGDRKETRPAELHTLENDDDLDPPNHDLMLLLEKLDITVYRNMKKVDSDREKPKKTKVPNHLYHIVMASPQPLDTSQRPHRHPLWPALSQARSQPPQHITTYRSMKKVDSDREKPKKMKVPNHLYHIVMASPQNTIITSGGGGCARGFASPTNGGAIQRRLSGRPHF